MDYQETRGTLCTKDTGQRQTKQKTINTTQKNKRRATRISPKKPGMNRSGREGSNSCFLLDTRRVTHIIKYGNNIVGDREQTKFYVKSKRSIVIWDMDIS